MKERQGLRTGEQREKNKDTGGERNAVTGRRI